MRPSCTIRVCPCERDLIQRATGAVRPPAGISHDRMMLLLAAVLLTVLGAVLAYTVLM